MKFPESLKIGAHEYSLKFLTHWEGSDEELAFTRYETQEIVVNSSLSESQKFAKVLHEGMHAMNPQMSHELLASLAEQMAQMLLDNGFIEEE
tara:strand:- start:181 stop:456 length:276 start_codon:yes stop_codon:yes gene_type:complete